MYPSGTINDDEIDLNLLLLPCGHSIHISCAHETEEITKITKCFICAVPFEHDLIPLPAPVSLTTRMIQRYKDASRNTPNIIAGAIAGGTVGVGASVLSGVCLASVVILHNRDIKALSEYDVAFYNYCAFIVLNSTIAGVRSGGDNVVDFFVGGFHPAIDPTINTAIRAAANTGRRLGNRRPIQMIMGSIAVLASMILHSWRRLIQISRDL